jgi:phosphohistidine phosphatase
MRRLVLFRHAKAERKAASGEDFDRALTHRGVDDARLIGLALAEAGVRPDLVLTSSAVRTRQTWAAAAAALGQPEVRAEKGLYNASAAQLRKAVEAVEDDHDTVVLVGHNPGLHQYAVELLVAGAASGAVLDRVTGKFPTATAVVYDLDVAGRPQFAAFLLAKDFGGGGED